MTDTRDITVAKVIRVGTRCGAQVLLTEEGHIAKIYDPLYYATYDEAWPDERVGVALAADQDYTIEAAAYSELLHTNLQGTIMPVFYGSWTMEVCTNVDGARYLHVERVA